MHPAAISPQLMNEAKSIKNLNWPNTLFLFLTPIGALAGLVWWIASGRLNLWTIVLTLVMAVATGLGITAGYHRLFSHRSYEAAWPVRLLMLLFGGAGFEGSAWEWCLDHRDHHRYIDGDRDPYNIKKGFWHAHILWLLFREPTGRDRERARDLWADPLVRFQHRLYVPLAIIVSFVFPMVLAMAWGDAAGGLLVAGLVRLVMNQHFTFAINSVCHVFGKQTYSDAHSARDNWITALFTYGEGYHNYHHEFPGDYRNGIRFYHWDPTKWLIRLLAATGLARNLVTVDAETILLRKQSQQQKKLAQMLSDQPRTVVEFTQRLVHAVQEQLHGGATRLRKLRKQYHQILRQGAPRTEDRRRLRQIRSQIHQGVRELRQTMALWETLVSRLSRWIAVHSSATRGDLSRRLSPSTG